MSIIACESCLAIATQYAKISIEGDRKRITKKQISAGDGLVFALAIGKLYNDGVYANSNF